MVMPAQSAEQTLVTDGRRRQEDLNIGSQAHLQKELYANQQRAHVLLKFRFRSRELFDMYLDISRLCRVGSLYVPPVCRVYNASLDTQR